MKKQLALSIKVSKEIDGLEMGVLSDGTSYLTGRSLARLCATAPSTIIAQGTNWKDGKRDNVLAKWLEEHGIDQDSLYVETEVAGTKVHAYPDDVCMLILEYYAFDAQRPSPDAQKEAQFRYRTLARAGLRAFVYHALGYDPTNSVPPSWREFHDRLLLVTSPVGFFSVFKEAADFVISAIRLGLKVDENNVPDISIGQHWSKYWETMDLERHYGKRTKFQHNYPDYFRQAKSNPQDIWVYPVSAIGAFRIWLQNEYVPKQFPDFLIRKVKRGMLSPSTAQLLISGKVTKVEELP